MANFELSLKPYPECKNVLCNAEVGVRHVHAEGTVVVRYGPSEVEIKKQKILKLCEEMRQVGFANIYGVSPHIDMIEDRVRAVCVPVRS